MELKYKIFNFIIPIFILVTLIPPTIKGHTFSELILIFFIFLLIPSGKKLNIKLGDHRIIILLITLCLSIYLSIVINDLFFQQLEMGYIYGTGYNYLCYIIVFLTAYNLTSYSTENWIVSSIIAVGVIISLIGIFQVFNLFNVSAFIGHYYSTETHGYDADAISQFRFRATSVMDSNPDILGSILLWPVIMISISIFEARKLLSKIILLFLLAINLFCFILAGAKTAIVVFLGWIITYIFSKNKFLFIIILVFNIILIIYIRSGDFNNSKFGYLLRGYQLLFTVNPQKTDTLLGRFYYWEKTIESLEGIKLFVGGGNTLARWLLGEKIYSDSTYIYFLIHGGLIGLSIYITLLIIIFNHLRKLYRKPLDNNTLKIFIQSFIYYFVSVLFIFITYGIGGANQKWLFVFWLQFGIFLKIKNLYNSNSYVKVRKAN